MRHQYPGLFGDPRIRGLRAAVGVSLLVHVLLLALVGGLKVQAPERNFFAPVHMVDLVEPGPKAGGPGPERKAPAPPPPPPPKPAPKEPPAQPVPRAEPPTAPKPEPPPAAAETVPRELAQPKPAPPQRTEEDVQAAIERMRERLPSPPAPSRPAQPPQPSAGGPNRDYGDIMQSLRQRMGTQPGGGGSDTSGTDQKVGVRGGSSANVLQQVRLRAYYNQLWDHVTSHWTIPPSLQGKDLSVIVSVIIDRKGGIVRSWIEEPSRSTAFDQSALRALERAEPLPAVPESVPDETLEIGFRFHPN